MYVTGKHVAHIAVFSDQQAQVGFFAQANPVHRRQIEFERRVVREQIDLTWSRFCQHAVEPGQTVCAQTTFMGAGFFGIEEDQTGAVGVDHALDKTMGIDRHVREHAAKYRAFVVIAQEQAHRQLQFLQAGGKNAIGGFIAVVGQIAGDHAQVGIGMVLIDMGDAGAKTADRVFAEQQIAVRYQVDVGDLYDFHQNVFFY